MSAAAARVTVATAASAGAVAVLQVWGAGIPGIPGVAGVFEQLTGVKEWPAERVRFVHFADIDEGLAVLWRADWGQLMPHGGPRVVRKLLDRLVELGCVYEKDPAAREVYPEAASDLEADMLAMLARAASPAAIDLLLEQPRLWGDFLEPSPFLGRGQGEGLDSSFKISLVTKSEDPHPNPLPKKGEGVLARAAILDRLVMPPSVVVVGRPNVGKSTLTNRMLGRAASIVADLPGTTRDWVAGLAEVRSVAVQWLDTPGIRASDDPIEQRAIELAADAIRAADVVIAMRDGEIDWPDASSLPRAADIRVANKIDRARPAAVEPGVIAISAETGTGVDQLERAVVAALGLSEIGSPRLWAFSGELKRILGASDWGALRQYVGERR